MTVHEREDPQPIKALIFDFGNVLCRLDRAATNVAIAAHSACSAQEVGARIWDGDIERDAETGKIDARGHFERVRAAVGAEGSWTFEDFAGDYMACILPNPDGEAALKAAAASGLRCFILSNTSFLHSRAIFQNETLATLTELQALSYKLGFMKPDPRCWSWLLERSSLQPCDCLYIDDKEEYCAAAADLGLTTLRYDCRSENLTRALEAVLYSPLRGVESPSAWRSSK